MQIKKLNLKAEMIYPSAQSFKLRNLSGALFPTMCLSVQHQHLLPIPGLGSWMEEANQILTQRTKEKSGDRSQWGYDPDPPPSKGSLEKGDKIPVCMAPSYHTLLITFLD